MTYTTIDGDVSDYLDSLGERTDMFSTSGLRTFLLNEGHSEEAVIEVIHLWQQSRFRQIDPQWETFGLTEAGRAAVEELRKP